MSKEIIDEDEVTTCENTVFLILDFVVNTLLIQHLIIN